MTDEKLNNSFGDGGHSAPPCVGKESPYFDYKVGADFLHRVIVITAPNGEPITGVPEQLCPVFATLLMQGWLKLQTNKSAIIAP
jgi:hypothetical protein